MDCQQELSPAPWISQIQAKKIGKLEITVPIKGREKANFTACRFLRLPAEFLGPEYAMEEPPILSVVF
jgi:hypothetical protein